MFYVPHTCLLKAMPVMKAMKTAPVAKGKAKAKAKAWEQGNATVNEQLLPVADVPETRFSLFIKEANGKWMLALVGDTIDAQSFTFNHLIEELGMSPHEAAGSVGNRDYYLATIGGKKIPSRAILSETVEHMSHVQVVERRRGGMEEQVVYTSWPLGLRFICSFNLDINSS